MKDSQSPPLNESIKLIEAEPQYDIEKICCLFGHSANGQAWRCDEKSTGLSGTSVAQVGHKTWSDDSR